MWSDTLRAFGRRVALRRRQFKKIIRESETRRVLHTPLCAARVSKSAQRDDRSRPGQETHGKIFFSLTVKFELECFLNSKNIKFIIYYLICDINIIIMMALAIISVVIVHLICCR